MVWIQAITSTLERFSELLPNFRLGIGDGRFELTPLSQVLRSDSQNSVRDAGRMIARASRAFPFLLENLRTGTCGYNLAFGKPIFEDLKENPHV
jgi:hypothetical protein